MKTKVITIGKILGLLFSVLGLLLFSLILGPRELISTQISSILFPLVAGYLLIALFILTLISFISLWHAGRKKKRMSILSLSLALVSLLALIMGGLEWTLERQIVVQNGGQMSLLGDPTISMSAQPDSQVVYATKDNQELTISLYQNKGQAAEKKQPVYIYIHGGGWSSGDAESSAWSHRAMADKGYVAFSINYRLATEDNPTWEKAIEDVADAIRWIKEHAEEYGGDSNNILLSGESAGGHLALLYTGLVSTGQLDAPLPSAVGVMYPAIDLTWTAENGRYLSSQVIPGIVERYIGGSLAEHQDRLQAVSPMAYINDKFPLVYIIHGEKDSLVTVSGSEEFVSELNKVGGQAQLVKIPFANHGLNTQVAVSLLSQFAEMVDGLAIRK